MLAALVLGWAWDVVAKRAPQKIVMALPGGLIVGYGDVGSPRPDVQDFLKIPELLTGWSGEALAPRHSRLRAFAVLADSTSICPLGRKSLCLSFALYPILKFIHDKPCESGGRLCERWQDTTKATPKPLENRRRRDNRVALYGSPTSRRC